MYMFHQGHKCFFHCFGLYLWLPLHLFLFRVQISGVGCVFSFFSKHCYILWTCFAQAICVFPIALVGWHFLFQGASLWQLSVLPLLNTQLKACCFFGTGRNSFGVFDISLQGASQYIHCFILCTCFTKAQGSKCFFTALVGVPLISSISFFRVQGCEGLKHYFYTARIRKEWHLSLGASV